MSDQESYVTIESSSDEDSDDVTSGLVTWKAELLRSLKAIKTFGDFACQKNHESFVNPGLEAADSLIPLPLIARDAEAIKAQCQQAPFGRGDQTVVDTSVRKTWELNTEQFRCSNPAWNPYLNTLLQEVAKSLGMHEGGDVHLSHADKNCVFATSGSSAFGLTALAWYSDVTHEIKEITSGYRLVLTYNIIQEDGYKTSAGYFLRQQTHLQSLIGRWRSEFPSTKRLVYRLEHKYSRQSLSLQHMKGRDKPLVQSLLGELVIGLPSLEHVSSALDTVEGLLARDELKQSFLKWRSSADMYRFDNKDSLDSKDLDLVLNIITSKADDDEWINSRLAPKLKECAERALLYKLLDGLFRKGEKNELARAEAIARRVLETTLPKLRLEIDDFSTSMVEKQPGDAYSRASSWDYPTFAVANFPVAGPSGIGCSAPEKLEYMPSSFVREFLEDLVDIAEKHQLPEIPSLRELFEILFRRYILFLAASDQVQARFTKAQTYRDHIEKQLSNQFFQWWTEPSSARGVNSTLVITKLGTEYAEDVQQFLRSVTRIEEGVRVFARDYVRRLLGDELYRELILLEKIRTPALQVTAQGNAITAPAGPPGALPALFGSATPAGAGGPPGPGVPRYAYVPAPLGPGSPGCSLPLLVLADTTAAAPPANSVPLNYPPASVPAGYPPTQFPPINPGYPATAQRTVLPPLQPTTGNSGVKRPAGGTWEQPEATKPRTSEHVDLTGE
ncbi:hypothetical protein DL764_005287 [Monosporascus ibericus]|uniref:Uncharacterized protein n=1 Tax=Monosporascus ibericus TaxID=155417 RepID=A0A4Q4TCR4_9PEZI|nr:hypothetical protein DL764_005287 [Monosporascus ibericus]